MINRFVCFLLVLAVVSLGCSTPDGDDMDRLVSMVGGWSQAAKARVVAYAMNRRAIDWFLQRPDKDQIGRIMCYGDDNALVEINIRTVKDALECLLTHPEATYVVCVEQITRDAAALANGQGKEVLAKKFGQKLSQCFGEVAVRYQAENTDDFLLTDPDAWEDEDIVRAILTTPGGLPLPGGLAPGFLGRLCPLATDPDAYGCPGDPLTPGGTPAPGGSSGGDR